MLVNNLQEAAELIAKYGGCHEPEWALLQMKPTREQLRQYRKNILMNVDRAIAFIELHYNMDHAESAAGKKSDGSETFVDEAFCPLCKKETRQQFYFDGHERDSSGCWQQCLECHARKWGSSTDWTITQPVLMT